MVICSWQKGRKENVQFLPQIPPVKYKEQERKKRKISQFHAVFQPFVKEMKQRRTLLMCFVLGAIKLSVLNFACYTRKK